MDKVQQNYERWLSSAKVNEEDKALLRAMSSGERDEAFFQDIQFGTGGMRGVLGPGTNRMNSFTVKRATIAFGLMLLKEFPHEEARGGGHLPR
jgi:phosphoglucomutase